MNMFRNFNLYPFSSTGPMMRPQHSMYMQHPGHGGQQRMPYGPVGMGQRPPNVQVNPDGMPMSSQQEWRQMLMSQQQSMNFNGGSGVAGGGIPGGMRPGFNPNHQGSKKKL